MAKMTKNNGQNGQAGPQAGQTEESTFRPIKIQDLPEVLPHKSHDADLKDLFPHLYQKKEQEEAPKKLLPPLKVEGLFTPAYQKFLEDVRLSIPARFLYLALVGRAGQKRFMWFGQENIYKDIGMKKSKFYDCLKELIQHGYVIRFQRTLKKNNAKTTSVLVVCEYDPFTECTFPPKNIKEFFQGLCNFYQQSDSNTYDFSLNYIWINEKEDHYKLGLDNRPTPEQKKEPGQIAIPVDNIVDNLLIDCGQNSGDTLVQNTDGVKTPVQNTDEGKTPSPKYGQGGTLVQNTDDPLVHISDANNIKDLNNINSFYFSLYTQACEGIRPELSETSYTTWIKPIEVVGIENDILILQTPSDFSKGVLESRYKKLILDELKALDPTIKDVKITA